MSENLHEAAHRERAFTGLPEGLRGHESRECSCRRLLAHWSCLELLSRCGAWLELLRIHGSLLETGGLLRVLLCNKSRLPVLLSRFGWGRNDRTPLWLRLLRLCRSHCRLPRLEQWPGRRNWRSRRERGLRHRRYSFLKCPNESRLVGAGLSSRSFSCDGL